MKKSNPSWNGFPWIKSKWFISFSPLYSDTYAMFVYFIRGLHLQYWKNWCILQQTTSTSLSINRFFILKSFCLKNNFHVFSGIDRSLQIITSDFLDWIHNSFYKNLCMRVRVCGTMKTKKNSITVVLFSIDSFFLLDIFPICCIKSILFFFSCTKMPLDLFNHYFHSDSV